MSSLGECPLDVLGEIASHINGLDVMIVSLSCKNIQRACQSARDNFLKHRKKKASRDNKYWKTAMLALQQCCFITNPTICELEWFRKRTDCVVDPSSSGIAAHLPGIQPSIMRWILDHCQMTGLVVEYITGTIHEHLLPECLEKFAVLHPNGKISASILREPAAARYALTLGLSIQIEESIVATAVLHNAIESIPWLIENYQSELLFGRIDMVTDDDDAELIAKISLLLPKDSLDAWHYDLVRQMDVAPAFVKIFRYLLDKLHKTFLTIAGKSLTDLIACGRFADAAILEYVASQPDLVVAIQTKHAKIHSGNDSLYQIITQNINRYPAHRNNHTKISLFRHLEAHGQAINYPTVDYYLRSIPFGLDGSRIQYLLFLLEQNSSFDGISFLRCLSIHGEKIWPLLERGKQHLPLVTNEIIAELFLGEYWSSLCWLAAQGVIMSDIVRQAMAEKY